MRAAIVIAVLLTAGPIRADAEAGPLDGRRVYERKCGSCHGETATEGAAGDIRGLGRSILARAVRGIDQMPKVPLSDAELDAVTAHLDALNRR